MLIMKIGPPPGASRTHWNPALTALERAGSGVSWRSSWPDTPGPCCWRCRS